jgi:RNA polymerase sigma-70 factor (ECF subfamily)
MFSSTSSSAGRADLAPHELAQARAPRRFPAAPDTEEAHELHLLAQVACWNDQAAFEQLYARHEAAVKRVAFGVCRSAQISEEIVQHTFTALWTRAQRLRDKSVRLRPWLTTVARNAAIDYLRGERLADSIEAAEQLASTDLPPDKAVLEKEAHAELAGALAALSDEQRAAVELVFFAGTTYRAAAAALGEPTGTVKSRVRLALGHLRERLAPAPVG